MRIITASATEPGEDITNAVRPNFSGHADRAGIELSLKSINHVMYKRKKSYQLHYTKAVEFITDDHGQRLAHM